MRLLSARLIVSLILGITLASLSSSYYQVLVERRALRKDLERRAEVLGESLAGNVEHLLDKGSMRALERTVKQFGNREHLIGIAIYDGQNNLIEATPEVSSVLATTPSIVPQALRENHGIGIFEKLGSARVHIYVIPLHRPDQEEVILGGLA